MDILNREHEIISKRRSQIELNWMCYKGGHDYVEKRLYRGVHEDDRSWKGNEGEGLPSRKERTHYVPYAERVVDKIEEYIWSKPIKRDGGSQEFIMNADRGGASVNEVIQLVQEYWTVCGWGWLNVDRTGGSGNDQTILDKELKNDGIYWTAYAPWEVPDWHYGDDGRLEWLLTEKRIYDNSDPMLEPFEGFIRTLWRRGSGTRYILDKGRGLIEQEDFVFSCPEVPFVRMGELTSEPHWFDNAEGIACALLNLESEAHTNLSKGVHSIPVVPAGAVERSISDGLGRAAKENKISTDDVKQVVEKVFSRTHPIVEDEESKGVTRFVSPPSGDLTAHPNEIERMKRALYEVVGLGVSKQKDTADAESADAKQYDHLDINAVLRERALHIQRLEKRAVAMSLEFDSTFAAYDPVYPTEFAVSDPAAMLDGATKMKDLGVPIPDELKLAIVRAIAEQIPNLSEDERQRITQQATEDLEEARDAILRIANAERERGGWTFGGGTDGAKGGPADGGAEGGESPTPPTGGEE